MARIRSFRWNRFNDVLDHPELSSNTDIAVQITAVSIARRVNAIDPDPMFVQRLEGALMSQVGAGLESGRSMIVAGSRRTGNPGVAQRLLDAHRPRHVRVGTKWLATCCVMMMLLVLGVLRFYPGGSGGSNESSLTIPAATDQATILATGSPVAPIPCTVAPRPREDFAQWAATPYFQSRLTPPYLPSDLTDPGVPVRRETATQISAMVNQMIECGNEGRVDLHYAFWTTDAIQRAINLSAQNSPSDLAGSLLESVDLVLDNPGADYTVSKQAQRSFVALTDAIELPSGRVRATATIDLADGRATFVMFFVNRNGQWLLDDAQYWTFLLPNQ